MIANIPKISVVIICYNQEKVISRAIESLLSQREYIYEICVSDDCSKDATWEILQNYSKKYPGLFVLNRNEPNIGVFDNIEKTWGMPTGDMIYRLAGDDECGAGWFEQVVNFIKKNKIDYVNNAICIYGDYRAVYPNGDSYIFQNNYICSKFPAIKLAIRGFVGNRSACFTSSVLKRYIPVSKGRSYIAEDAQDRLLQACTDTNYYIPYVGNVYYARIGVSNSLSSSIIKEREGRMLYLKEILDILGVKLDKKDYAYINYVTCKLMGKNVVGKLYWMRSIEVPLLFSFKKLRRYIFAAKIRLPHHRPIIDYKI